MLQYGFVYSLVKELLTVESGEAVILKLINHGSRLPEVDNAGHPVQYLSLIHI